MALSPTSSHGSSSSAAVGSTSLIYRYTVAGVDKASIDTGVDTADAGSLDWTAGNLLEIFLYLRTDESTVTSVFDLTFNNDTGNNYIRQSLSGNNATAAAAYAAARASAQLNSYGASATASFFSGHVLFVPNYAGTVGFKTVGSRSDRFEASGLNSEVDVETFGYKSATALTRLKIAPTTAAKKFIVGSQLLIYKRSSS